MTSFWSKYDSEHNKRCDVQLGEYGCRFKKKTVCADIGVLLADEEKIRARKLRMELDVMPVGDIITECKITETISADRLHLMGLKAYGVQCWIN